eukprot:scaffold676664_cov60-Prasinocladus_malaysianus.AAC.1
MLADKFDGQPGLLNSQVSASFSVDTSLPVPVWAQEFDNNEWWEDIDIWQWALMAAAFILLVSIILVI